MPAGEHRDAGEPSSRLVYKVLRREEVVRLVADGSFAGSPDDLRDGFVHLSTADQVKGTLERHFAAENGLFIVTLQASALGEALRWEPSRKGALFPHLYRALAMGDVTTIAPVPDEREDWSLTTVIEAPDASIGRGN